MSGDNALVQPRQRLDDAGYGDRVALVPDPRDQAAQDAERDRQRQDERRADAALRLRLDRPAQLLSLYANSLAPYAVLAALPFLAWLAGGCA